MKKLLLALTCIMLTSLAASANLTVEVVDDNGDRLNSDLLLEQNGQEVTQSNSFLETEIKNGENYNLTQNIGEGPTVKIINFSIEEDFDFRPILYDSSPGPGENFLINTDPLYFVNQSIPFSKAQISTDRPEPDRIAKCSMVVDSECGDWTINTTEDYSNSVNDGINSENYLYEVDSFSGYTTGDISALPQIGNLTVFDVTEAVDKRNEGEIIDEGLNKTFLLDQKQVRQYRFSFNISNQGSDTWNLDSGDVLQHTGLNESWNISDIYYEIQGDLKEGGTFSNGEIEWNTGNGGTLQPGDHIQAEYIVNITQNSSNTFDQEIEASTSDTADYDIHKLEILKYGDLFVDLERPENGTVVQNNREFIMNGTVSCQNGDCGQIEVEPQRNTSSGQQSFSGELFEIDTQNSTENCNNLLEGQLCEVTWSINATGNPNTFHDLNFKASSAYSLVASESTVQNLVEIRDIFMMSLNWDTVNFGVLDPGDSEKPAENNTEGYKLEISEESNTVDSLWVKASSLIHENNENYSIGPGNITYARENNYNQSTQLTEEYSLFGSNILPGTTENLYYWLNVPYGILRGGYSGTITFKANSTVQ